MQSIQSSLAEAGLSPLKVIELFTVRYDEYAKAYSEDPRTCGREKLMLFQAAQMLDGVLSVKIEGVVITLGLGGRKSVIIPANTFYT
jgi:hypothetical protein